METTIPGSWSPIPKPPTKPWGWLYPTRNSKSKPFALTKKSHSFGRGRNCDYQFSEDNQFDQTLLPVLSRIHFTIERGDPSNVDEAPSAYIVDTSFNGTFVNGRRIRKNTKEILRGDSVISISEPDLKVFIFVTEATTNWIPAEYDSKYTVQTLLEKRTFGEVRLAQDKANDEIVAIVKKVKKPNNNNGAFSLNDVETLREVKHINIFTLKDFFESPDYTYFVMECIQGETLQMRVTQNGALKDQDAKIIFVQLSNGLYYLAGMKILHVNIKPLDVLLKSSKNGDFAKISLSKRIFNGLNNVYETSPFTAPEVVYSNGEGDYSHKVDVWSLGVTLFYSLSADLPFNNGRNGMSMQEQILRGSYQMPVQVWRSVNRLAQKLVRSMLTVNPEDRLSAHEVLQHQWFQDEEMKVRLSRILSEVSD